MKVHLIELIKEFKNNDNESASINKVNVSTVRIEVIHEETPAVTEVEVELMKLSQESVPKKLQFL